MIDASKLVAAHLASQAKTATSSDMEAGEAAPRQYPLAGMLPVRPLADPARRNSESKQ
jgi:hypothetical protein